jgi:hypothetical protein
VMAASASTVSQKRGEKNWRTNPSVGQGFVAATAALVAAMPMASMTSGV